MTCPHQRKVNSDRTCLYLVKKSCVSAAGQHQVISLFRHGRLTVRLTVLTKTNDSDGNEQGMCSGNECILDYQVERSRPVAVKRMPDMRDKEGSRTIVFYRLRYLSGVGMGRGRLSDREEMKVLGLIEQNEGGVSQRERGKKRLVRSACSNLLGMKRKSPVTLYILTEGNIFARSEQERLCFEEEIACSAGQLPTCHPGVLLVQRCCYTARGCMKSRRSFLCRPFLSHERDKATSYIEQKSFKFTDLCGNATLSFTVASEDTSTVNMPLKRFSVGCSQHLFMENVEYSQLMDAGVISQPPCS
ncbi:hypothetical protein ACHWQZ_G017636 [Mnemiopsis leidyi]